MQKECDVPIQGDRCDVKFAQFVQSVLATPYSVEDRAKLRFILYGLVRFGPRTNYNLFVIAVLRRSIVCLGTGLRMHPNADTLAFAAAAPDNGGRPTKVRSRMLWSASF